MTEIILCQDKQEILNCVLKQQGKTLQDFVACIEIIKKWFKTQGHLPETPPNEFIGSYLIACKFSVEKCKQKLDMYYNIRTIIPEFFYNKSLKLPHMQKMLAVQYYVRLPQLTKDGNRIFFVKHFSDPEIFDVIDCCALAFKLLELLAYKDCAVGDIFIYDFSQIKLGHILKLTPTIIKKIYLIYFECFAGKLKGVHFINAPTFADSLLNILKQMLKPKLAERVHMHRDMERLAEFIPLEILPVEYGGKERPLEELHELTVKMMQEFQPRFDELEKLKTDESKRPAPLVNDDILGYFGNFRKIDID